MKKIVYFFVFNVFASAGLFFAVTVLHAATHVKAVTINEKIPYNLISLESRYAILVEKSTQQLYLYQAQEDVFHLIKSYTCSTGKNRGDKEESGDLKTPEGCYFFREIFQDQQLPSKYGVKAFVTDFPNELDRKEGKKGNGIWLHGLDKPLLPYDTQGCVALHNSDLEELSGYIDLFSTPIIIEENIRYVSYEAIQKEKKEACALLKHWNDSWKNKELEEFIQCYSRDRFGKQKLNSLRQTKSALNSTYKFIDVLLKDINIVRHDTTLITGFVQVYESDRFKSTGFKKLYFQKNSDIYKIVGEDLEMPNYFGEKAGQYYDDERNVRRTLNGWIIAWEQKNIEKYMRCYSNAFVSQNMNRNQWRTYKDTINKSTGSIHIGVEKTKVTIQDKTASVMFIQKYDSDVYMDYGLKKLKLQNENGKWKIIAETWEPIN